MNFSRAQIGIVSSVNVKTRTARVVFSDKANMVSAPLVVLQNSPLINISVTTNGEKWEMEEKYSSVPRDLGANEIYTKSKTDIIKGESKQKSESFSTEVHSWLPYIGQTVLCILLQDGEGDGYIVGGV